MLRMSCSSEHPGGAGWHDAAQTHDDMPPIQLPLTWLPLPIVMMLHLASRHDPVALPTSSTLYEHHHIHRSGLGFSSALPSRCRPPSSKHVPMTSAQEPPPPSVLSVIVGTGAGPCLVFPAPHVSFSHPLSRRPADVTARERERESPNRRDIITSSPPASGLSQDSRERQVVHPRPVLARAHVSDASPAFAEPRGHQTDILHHTTCTHGRKTDHGFSKDPALRSCRAHTHGRGLYFVTATARATVSRPLCSGCSAIDPGVRTCGHTHNVHASTYMVREPSFTDKAEGALRYRVVACSWWVLFPPFRCDELPAAKLAAAAARTR